MMEVYDKGSPWSSQLNEMRANALNEFRMRAIIQLLEMCLLRGYGIPCKSDAVIK